MRAANAISDRRSVKMRAIEPRSVGKRRTKVPEILFGEIALKIAI
jgi:hypothetical protein